MSNRAKVFFSGLVLFTLSMSSLGLEIIFLRYFSFLFKHSYVYILISLVMAGLGFGSVVLYFMNENTRQRYFKQIRFLPLVLFVLLIVDKCFIRQYRFLSANTAALFYVHWILHNLSFSKIRSATIGPILLRSERCIIRCGHQHFYDGQPRPCPIRDHPDSHSMCLILGVVQALFPRQ